MYPERVTATLPWYEEADFSELMVLAGDAGLPHLTYKLWYRSAMQTVDDFLRAGQSVAFVTIRPAAYTAWLEGRPNTPAMRRTYAEYLARRSDLGV